MFAEAPAHLNDLGRRPDLLLLTGDLVDEGCTDEYAMVRELLLTSSIPFLVIPGNHDSRENFRAAFHDRPYLPAEETMHLCVDDHPMRFIEFDSGPT